VIHLIFGRFSAMGEEDISTVYANCIAGSREQRQASSMVRLPINLIENTICTMNLLGGRLV
jgi:hypothetical protein